MGNLFSKDKETKPEDTKPAEETKPADEGAAPAGDAPAEAAAGEFQFRLNEISPERYECSDAFLSSRNY